MGKDDVIITYFYGEVMLFEQLVLTAKYIVVSSGVILEIDNSMHIRMVDDQKNLPAIFFVIAPVIAIKPFSGTISSDLIVQLPAKEYLRLRKIHHGE